MEHRHHGQADGFGAGVAPQATAHDVGHQRAVRVFATFGQARGARGVRQQRQVVGLALRRARQMAGGQRIGPARGADRQRVLGKQPGQHRRRRAVAVFDVRRQRVGVGRDQQVLQAVGSGQAVVRGSHRGGQVGRGDGHAGLRVGDVVAELFGEVHRVHRHDDRIGTLHGIESDQELRAVLQVQQHAVTTLYALGLQPTGELFSLAMQLAIRHGAA